MLQQATHQKDTFRTKKELLLKLCDIIFYAYWTCKVGQPFYTIFQTFQHLVDGLFLTIILMDSMFEILQNDQLRWGFIILHESYTKIHTYSVYM